MFYVIKYPCLTKQPKLLFELMRHLTHLVDVMKNTLINLTRKLRCG